MIFKHCVFVEDVTQIAYHTLDEILTLLADCKNARQLLSWFLRWWVIAGLLIVTYPITNLSVCIFRVLTKNDQSGVPKVGQFFVLLLYLAFGIMVTLFALAPSYKIVKELQAVKHTLKRIYISKRTKAKWNSKDVPAKFVIDQIIDEIDSFKGFVTFGSNSIMVWFFTFFLFFVQFGVQTPENKGEEEYFICTICNNCTNSTIFCTN